MSKNRMVQTKIWSDDWFMELPPEAKLLYLFFLTNKVTQISGYYQLGLKEIEFFTGIKIEKLKKLLPLLEPKVHYSESWVVVKNYAKYQNVANNLKVKVLIEKLLTEVPEAILNIKSKSKSKSEPIDSLSIAYTQEHISGANHKDNNDLSTPVDKGVNSLSTPGDKPGDKKKYGEFKNVLLTDLEKEKVKQKYGLEVAKSLVEELSVGIKSHGYVYKDHYATLLSWARKKKLEVIVGKSVPKMIPEVQPNGSIRLVTNPAYHG